MIRPPDMTGAPIRTSLDLVSPGKRSGIFELLWSDNAVPLGVYPVPVMVIVGAPGPTAILSAGVHGDEYEGPAALMKLFGKLSPDQVTGRLIFLPQLNAPACKAGTRCSPLDGENLNRSCPGDPKGGPTAQIAALLSKHLMPVADAVIDLHSGGQASWFLPCSLAARTPDGALDMANMALARAFGAETIWVLPGSTGNGSVNNAATALGVTCIAAELGGGGYVGAGAFAFAERGLQGALMHLSILTSAAHPGTPPGPGFPPAVEFTGPEARVVAPVSGLYEPFCCAGDMVAAGTVLGMLHDLERPGAAATEVRSSQTGLVLAETRRGYTRQGDFIAFVATPITEVLQG